MNTVNASTGFSPFQLHLGRSPRVLPPLFTPAVRDAETAHGTAARDAAHVIRRVETDFMEAQDNLLLAKMNQAIQANKSRGDEIQYAVGDKVMLSTTHRRRDYMRRGDHRVAKFMVRFDGPYEITQAFPNTSTYTLRLPSHLKIFPTFHASLLKPWRPNDDTKFPTRAHARPGPIVGDSGEDEWPVERILDSRKVGRGYRYLVRWEGYGPADDSWIPGSEARLLACFGDWLLEHNPEAYADWKNSFDDDVPAAAAVFASEGGGV